MGSVVKLDVVYEQLFCLGDWGEEDDEKSLTESIRVESCEIVECVFDENGRRTIATFDLGDGARFVAEIDEFGTPSSIYLTPHPGVPVRLISMLVVDVSGKFEFAFPATTGDDRDWKTAKKGKRRKKKKKRMTTTCDCSDQ